MLEIIAGTAASWNFIQAKWNGHYFHNLIIKELGELEPADITRNNDGSLRSDGLLKTHLKKEFMHREILYKPTENKEFICSVDNSLIYHTRQVWSAFDNNDVKEFLKNLAYISVDNRYRLKIIPIRYDRRNKISDALDEWINLVKMDGPPIVEKNERKYYWGIRKRIEPSIHRERINPIFFRAPPPSK